MKLDSKYNHTQIGYLIIFALLAIILYFRFILARADLNLLVIIIMLPIVFLLLSFISLNVVVDEKYLRIKFGYGIFKKHFALEEITSVKTARNHWYYGWGIRGWAWPPMQIYNVSGFDAIEIKMENDKTYRIGTDEPKNLECAVKQAIKQ